MPTLISTQEYLLLPILLESDLRISSSFIMTSALTLATPPRLEGKKLILKMGRVRVRVIQ
jgi:hypothetical protein